MTKALITICAVALSAPSLTAQPRPAARLSAEERAAIVDTIARTLRSLYVIPEQGEAMAAALERRRQANGFAGATTHRALLDSITRVVRSVHRDAHLGFRYDPEQAAEMADTTPPPPPPPDRDPAVRDRRNNYQFRGARILPGNIGYIEFHQFADTSADARKTVQAAMQFVANTDALILDLRENRGGSAAMASELSGYFVRDSVVWFRSYNRLLDRWTDQWTRNDSRVTGGLVLEMPITILTSVWTYSAAEGLAYALQQGRGARVVGEPSAGGAHVVRRVSLGHGVIGFVPYIRGVHVATNANWEGVGIRPDLRTDAPSALLRAREAILAQRAAAAPDSGARHAADFAARAARAEEHLVDVSVATLQRYVGVFGEYTFAIRDHRLYATNRIRNNRVDRLRAITPDLFQVDSESQVQFVRSADGVVRSIRILWNDGWIDTLDRGAGGT